MVNYNCSIKKHKNDPIKIFIIIFIVIVSINLLLRDTSVFYRKKILLPFSLHLNRQDLVMVKGEEFRLFVWGINKRVSFSSTNFRVAGVNFNGRVFAYRTGKTYIIAKVDGKELKCRVRVIDINKATLNLKVGKSSKLKIEGIAAFPNWKSSNTEVASVNRFGKVTAHKKGKTVITARVKGKELKSVVYVN